MPAGEDIRRWVLTAVSAGVTALSFWVTRAEIMAAEANGFSLLDSTGESTPRFEEAARIGGALNEHAGLFGEPSWPGAPAAILIDEWNYQFCSSLVQGGAHLPYSVRGWHRLLWESGIAVDFVEASELDELSTGAYKALILPFPLLLSERVAAKLARYVEKGGNLISEACPGRIDEHAYCNRGELSPTMRDLFGVQQTGLTMVREPGNGARWSPVERSWGEYLDAAMLDGAGALQGSRLRANVYVETFACQGSEACLRYGDAVAGTVRTVGEGRAWLLGTYLGHNGTAYRDAESRQSVRMLLAQCGVAPEHRGELLVRRRVGDDQEAWLLTNPTDGEVTECIDVGGWTTVTDLLGETVVRTGDQVALTVGSLDVCVLILAE